jgi:hypothetical protein
MPPLPVKVSLPAPATKISSLWVPMSVLAFLSPTSILECNSHKIQIHVYILNFVISGLTIWDIDTIFGDLGVNVYLCLGRATTRSHSSQWSKKKVAVET